MLDKEKSLEMLEGFASHYGYDTGYMKEMLHVSPEAYETFESFLPMASFHKSMPIDVQNVVKIVTTKNEDCGSCLQLVVDMALEAGVNKDIVKDIVFNEGGNLPQKLKDVYTFALIIAQNKPMDSALYDKISTMYSKDIMMEISLVIASAKVFPTIKRTLNEAKSCSLIEVKI